MMKLIFATHNLNKVKEVQKIVPNFITIASLNDLGYVEEIPETEPDLKGNALQKARYVFEKFGKNCFADDTGLEVTALNGAPGVYSARYGGPEKNNEKNIDLVLNAMLGEKNRSAQFRTVIALILKGKEYIFEGIVRGEIRYERKGTFGFGYDAIFEPESCGKTYAEISLEEKNKTSHRSKAFGKMSGFLSDI